MRIFRRTYYQNTMKNRRKKSNRHNNSQSQPLHAHRTAGKDYHERIVNIQGGTFTFNVNIGDKHQDTKTLITNVTRGVQQAVATMAHAGEAEEWEVGTEGPAQKGMDILHTPQAMAMWRKLQEAGYVDENLRPQMNQTQASILAMVFFQYLDIEPAWGLFEKLWGFRNLRCLHSTAMKRNHYCNSMKKYQSVLKYVK